MTGSVVAGGNSSRSSSSRVSTRASIGGRRGVGHGHAPNVPVAPARRRGETGPDSVEDVAEPPCLRCPVGLARQAGHHRNDQCQIVACCAGRGTSPRGCAGSARRSPSCGRGSDSARPRPAGHRTRARNGPAPPCCPTDHRTRGRRRSRAGCPSPIRNWNGIPIPSTGTRVRSPMAIVTVAMRTGRPRRVARTEPIIELSMSPAPSGSARKPSSTEHVLPQLVERARRAAGRERVELGVDRIDVDVGAQHRARCRPRTKRGGAAGRPAGCRGRPPRTGRAGRTCLARPSSHPVLRLTSARVGVVHYVPRPCIRAPISRPRPTNPR